jgi:thioester reductase-like protein
MALSTAMPADVVLVTGYPSLLARAVCAETLEVDRNARVVCVVRPKLSQEARAFVDALPQSQRERVRLMEGDAAAIDLGLSGVEYKALAREVTRIHHCAQVTYQGVDRVTAERVNVGGAREALELAGCSEKLECLVFHSTAEVSGDRRGIVLEGELEAGQSFRNVVQETKARAEKLMRQAMGRLPIAIVRPSTVVGDTRTGEVDRFDGPYLLILLVVTSPPDLALPLPGAGDESLNLVPIDWVARSAVAIGREPGARGKTFHLVDAAPLTARRVFELVARAGGRRGLLGSIPAGLAKTILRAPGIERIAKSPRAFLETLTTPVTYDARHAEEMQDLLGVGPCPPLETYVDKLVEYVQERVRQRRTMKKADEEVDVDDPLV